MKTPTLVALPLAALALTACTVMPTGPSVTVLPGTGKSFDQFRIDDMNCRQYAFAQVGGVSSSQAANTSAVGSAAVGTAVGALAGAALGGNHQGAATGAGVGLLMGSAVGAGNAQSAAYGSQRGYDAAYIQCMYAYGHRVPIYGRMMSNQGTAAPAYPSPMPPAPPGYYPPR